MPERKYLAFDFGASSGRAYIGAFDGEKIFIEEIHRFSNDPVIMGKTMYWDILRLFHEIKLSLIKAKKFGEIRSIGIDTWGVDFGLIRNNGALVDNPVHYRDSRTVGMLEKAFKKINKSEFYSITGNQFMEINTAFQLLSLIENDRVQLERAQTMLLMPDLFNYLLTNEKKCEMSIASTTQLFDQKKKCWSEKVVKALGIKEEILPEIIPSGSIVGEITDELCQELDIKKIKVVAVCGHDTQDAMLSVPASEEDFIFISCGTWSLFGTELSEPLMSDKAYELNVTNETGFGGRISFLKNIIGLWLIQESKRAFHKQGKDYSFADMERMARQADGFKCFIDPDDPLFTPAGNIPERVRRYCIKTNQYVPQSDGEVIRCIYESLAYKYKSSFEEIKLCTGKDYNRIYIVGGGVKDSFLCQLTADSCGREVVSGSDQATVLGNLACQLISDGEISDIKSAREIMKASCNAVKYKPQDSSQWLAEYERFKEVTQCSKVYRK